MENLDYILCTVEFTDDGTTNKYISPDETVEAGDYVEIAGTRALWVAKVLETEKCDYSDYLNYSDQKSRIVRILKKHNAEKSTEKSVYGEIPAENNPDEDINTSGLFKCLLRRVWLGKRKLTEKKIANFEKINNIKLPAQYRHMLLKKGNGMTVFYNFWEYVIFKSGGDYRYIHGIDWKEKIPNERLSRPFPFGALEKVHIDDLPYPQYKDCMAPYDNDNDYICRICDHKYDCIHADFWAEDRYIENGFYNGTLHLMYVGCTYSYYLILNGPRRGEVWLSDHGTSFHRYAKSFKEFLEKVCTEEIM